MDPVLKESFIKSTIRMMTRSKSKSAPKVDAYLKGLVDEARKRLDEASGNTNTDTNTNRNVFALHPDIMDQITKNLPLEDIESIRLVNKEAKESVQRDWETRKKDWETHRGSIRKKVEKFMPIVLEIGSVEDWKYYLDRYGLKGNEPVYEHKLRNTKNSWVVFQGNLLSYWLTMNTALQIAEYTGIDDELLHSDEIEDMLKTIAFFKDLGVSLRNATGTIINYKTKKVEYVSRPADILLLLMTQVLELKEDLDEEEQKTFRELYACFKEVAPVDWLLGEKSNSEWMLTSFKYVPYEDENGYDSFKIGYSYKMKSVATTWEKLVKLDAKKYNGALGFYNPKK